MTHLFSFKLGIIPALRLLTEDLEYSEECLDCEVRTLVSCRSADRVRMRDDCGRRGFGDALVLSAVTGVRGLP